MRERTYRTLPDRRATKPSTVRLLPVGYCTSYRLHRAVGALWRINSR